jgi:hypothetical protein
MLLLLAVLASAVLANPACSDDARRGECGIHLLQELHTTGELTRPVGLLSESLSNFFSTWEKLSEKSRQVVGKYMYRLDWLFAAADRSVDFENVVKILFVNPRGLRRQDLSCELIDVIVSGVWEKAGEVCDISPHECVSEVALISSSIDFLVGYDPSRFQNVHELVVRDSRFTSYRWSLAGDVCGKSETVSEFLHGSSQLHLVQHAVELSLVELVELAVEYAINEDEKVFAFGDDPRVYWNDKLRDQLLESAKLEHKDAKNVVKFMDRIDRGIAVSILLSEGKLDNLIFGSCEKKIHFLQSFGDVEHVDLLVDETTGEPCRLPPVETPSRGSSADGIAQGSVIEPRFIDSPHSRRTTNVVDFSAPSEADEDDPFDGFYRKLSKTQLGGILKYLRDDETLPDPLAFSLEARDKKKDLLRNRVPRERLHDAIVATIGDREAQKRLMEGVERGNRPTFGTADGLELLPITRVDPNEYLCASEMSEHRPIMYDEFFDKIGLDNVVKIVKHLYALDGNKSSSVWARIDKRDKKFLASYMKQHGYRERVCKAITAVFGERRKWLRIMNPVSTRIHGGEVNLDYLWESELTETHPIMYDTFFHNLLTPQILRIVAYLKLKRVVLPTFKENDPKDKIIAGLKYNVNRETLYNAIIAVIGERNVQESIVRNGPNLVIDHENHF